MPHRTTRRLVGALTALLALASAPAALAIPPDGPVVPDPTQYGYQLINNQSGMALTAGSSTLSLSTRSATNKAQQFKRTTLTGGSYLYRYESVKYPGRCLGATVVSGKGTPAMIACSTGPKAWQFYDPYPDASSGVLYIETNLINNGLALVPSTGSSLKFADVYWTSNGSVFPPANAYMHSLKIALE